MTTQSALSHHEVHLSVWQSGTRRGKGLWQDKSRKVLGGWMGKKSRNNNVHGKGASAAITLLTAIIRWKICELYTLRFDAP